MILSAFFTDEGSPATGLVPTISVWSLNTSTKIVDAANMTEVGEGFYKYDFTTYDPSVPYTFIADGGAGLATIERYRMGCNDGDQTQYSAVAGSMGEAMVAFAKGKYHFNKISKVETLYREDGTTVVTTRTVVDSPTEISKS